MKKLVCLLISAIMTLSLFAGLTLSVAAEDTVDVSENYHDELPVRFDPSIDCFELEDLFDEDGSGFNRNTNGSFDYYFLKGEYGKTYMTIKFPVEEAGTYELCLGLMGIGSTVPRTAEWQVNGGQRYYVSRLYTGYDSANGVADYVDGITVYLRAGENTITFYTGYDFDNTNVKSVFIDKVFYARTGDLPEGYKFPDDEGGEEEQVDVTGAVPELVKFNSNFKSLITSTIYCSYDFVDDAEKGNVMKLTVTDPADAPRFTFSYKKYMKLLGLDPETDTCNKYNYLVLSVKVGEGFALDTSYLFSFTNGVSTFGTNQYQEFLDLEETGWQYIIYEMDTESYWAGTYDGGCFLFGGAGSEEGAVAYVSELALFENLEDAENYAGGKPASETTTSADPTDVTTSPEIGTESATDADTTANVTEAAETGAGTTVDAAETTAESKKSGCGGTLTALAVAALCPIAYVIGRKKED